MTNQLRVQRDESLAFLTEASDSDREAREKLIDGLSSTIDNFLDARHEHEELLEDFLRDESHQELFGRVVRNNEVSGDQNSTYKLKESKTNQQFEQIATVFYLAGRVQSTYSRGSGHHAMETVTTKMHERGEGFSVAAIGETRRKLAEDRSAVAKGNKIVEGLITNFHPSEERDELLRMLSDLRIRADKTYGGVTKAQWKVEETFARAINKGEITPLDIVSVFQTAADSEYAEDQALAEILANEYMRLGSSSTLGWVMDLFSSDEADEFFAGHYVEVQVDDPDTVVGFIASVLDGSKSREDLIKGISSRYPEWPAVMLQNQKVHKRSIVSNIRATTKTAIERAYPSSRSWITPSIEEFVRQADSVFKRMWGQYTTREYRRFTEEVNRPRGSKARRSSINFSSRSLRRPEKAQGNGEARKEKPKTIYFGTQEARTKAEKGDTLKLSEIPGDEALHEQIAKTTKLKNQKAILALVGAVKLLATDQSRHARGAIAPIITATKVVIDGEPRKIYRAAAFRIRGISKTRHTNNARILFSSSEDTLVILGIYMDYDKYENAIANL